MHACLGCSRMRLQVRGARPRKQQQQLAARELRTVSPACKRATARPRGRRTVVVGLAAKPGATRRLGLRALAAPWSTPDCVPDYLEATRDRAPRNDVDRRHRVEARRVEAFAKDGRLCNACFRLLVEGGIQGGDIIAFDDANRAAAVRERLQRASCMRTRLSGAAARVLRQAQVQRGGGIPRARGMPACNNSALHALAQIGRSSMQRLRTQAVGAGRHAHQMGTWSRNRPGST
jgi:hypothetical protein